VVGRIGDPKTTAGLRTGLLLLGLALSGFGEGTGHSAEPTAATIFASPAPPEVDFAAYELPTNEAEADEWTREHLDLYPRGVTRCSWSTAVAAILRDLTPTRKRRPYEGAGARSALAPALIRV
jgi:hypothetical protein